MKKLSIIIPACNEENYLKETLDSYIAYFSRDSMPDFEILVICNGCTDATPEIAEAYNTDSASLKSINIQDRIGKGGALKKGAAMATGDVIAFVDADNSIIPSEMWKLIQPIGDTVDGTIGSRSLPGAVIIKGKPITWRAASKGFNWLVRMLFGIPFRDTQCGAKIFKKEVLDAIMPDVIISGMTFDVEILWRANKKGYRIKEMPIIWSHEPKQGSTNNLPGTILRIALEMARLRLKS
jgi:glycosyltransferase involved in cell wall biosynthesis